MRTFALLSWPAAALYAGIGSTTASPKPTVVVRGELYVQERVSPVRPPQPAKITATAADPRTNIIGARVDLSALVTSPVMPTTSTSAVAAHMDTTWTIGFRRSANSTSTRNVSNSDLYVVALLEREETNAN